jgi:hypothetical protein
VRLRLPVMLERGADPRPEPASRDTPADGPREVSGEADVPAAEHAPVRSDQKAKRTWPLTGARTAAGGLLALPSGRAFAAVTLAPAVLAVAWLVPGTGMLLAGRLRPAPMVIIFVPLAVALGYFAVRQLPASWPGPEAGPGAAGADRRKASWPAGALVAMIVIAAGFGVWQAFFRSEQVFVASDPGVYLQYGYWIAGHGTARIPESAAAFGGTAGLDFASAGFSASGDSVTPAFLPGLPLVLAGGAWLGGLGGALLMPAVLGGCAVLSFGGLAGRLCGAWWGVAAQLVLAASLPEVYVSRTPLSEPLVQVLLFGGLCLFTDSFVVRRRDAGGPGGARGGLVLAGLGGLALGLTVLASIGSLGALLPVFPVLAVLLVARRPQAGPFGLGLFAGIGLGLSAALVLARPYLATVSAQLHLIGLCAVGFGVATALAAPLALAGVRSRVRRACAFNVRFTWFKAETVVLPSLGGVAQWLALALPAAVLVGLAERPYFQTVRGQADPAMIRAVAALQRLERVPVDGLRQYYESSLAWTAWYLGVPALLLACAGAAALGRRSVRAALEGRSAAGVLFPVVRLWGLPLLITAWSVVTVLWDPAVVPWQPAASRRLVPVVLPGLVLLAVWMSSWLASRASALGASRTAIAGAAACCVLALAIPTVVTTLNPGLAAEPSVGRYSSGVSKLVSRVRLRGVGSSATYGGSVAAAAALCASIGQSASVLLVDSSTAATFAPAVRGLCGQPAALAVLGSSASSVAELDQAVNSIERTGRRPVLLGPTRSSVSLPGTASRQVVSLRTSGDAESLTGAPAGTWPVTYSLWLAVPAGTAF